MVRIFIENNLFALVLLGILFICTIILAVYYFRFLKIKKDKQKANPNMPKQLPVSVVIATRNEHDQVRQNLPFFLNQNYSNFEIVVVIDDSDKELGYIMQEFEKQYHNLKVVSFEWSRNFFVNHRFAESIGIKSATHDRILLSAITTRPASPEWIARMSQTLCGNKKIVIGYHAMMQKPSFANAFVRFETFFYTLQYLRATLFGKPFTSSMKNIAFERSLFYEAKGVARFYNVNTGDEDMFVNKAANKSNTTIEIHPDAFVKGQTKSTFGEWFGKRVRRRVLFKEFKPVNRFLLGTYEISLICFHLILLTMPACFFLPETSLFAVPAELLMLAGGIFILKILTQWIVFKNMMSRFEEHGFLLLIPVFDLLMLIIQPVLFFYGLFTKRITWK